MPDSGAGSPAPGFTIMMAGVALAIMPLAVVAPIMIAWAAAVPALWAAVVYARAGRLPRAGRWWPVPAMLAAVVGYGGLTMLWSVLPDRSLRIAVALIPIFAGGWLLTGAASELDENARARVSTAFLVGSAVAVALIVFEIATGGLLGGFTRGEGLSHVDSLYHLNRAASALTILIWPLWLVLDRKFGPLVAAGGVVLAAMALLGLDPSTPRAAVVAGALFLALAHRAPQTMRWLLTGGLLVAALAIPLYPLLLPAVNDVLSALAIDDLPLRHRLSIWDFVATKVLDRPAIGWGLGAARAIPGADTVLPQLNDAAVAIPLHPHNALLQIWLELGLPGILLAVAVLGAVLAAIPRFITRRKERAVALTVFFSAMLVAELSYGIWQSWWLVFLWLAAALTIALADRPAATPDLDEQRNRRADEPAASPHARAAGSP